MVEKSGKLMTYNKLHPFQHFGGLISEEVINFSVTGAESSSTLLFIPKRFFQTFLKMNPHLEKTVREYQTQHAITDFLIRKPMFSYVPTKDLQNLVSSLKTKDLQPNEILIRQGDGAKVAYIVKEGSLTVYIDEHPNQVVRTMMPGDLVGEIALLKKTKRTSNVIAQTEASVFVLPQKKFMTLFKEQEQLHEWVNQLVQERLGSTQTDLKAKFHAKDYKTWLKDRLGLFPVLQLDKPQNSGAACLAMVCSYYGKQIDLDWVRRKILENHSDTSQEDASISDLSQVAEKIGLLPLAVLSSYEHLRQSCLPAIVGWKGGHWVVVYQITDNKVSMVDPAHDALKISKETFMDNWFFSTLYLKPTEHFFGK